MCIRDSNPRGVGVFAMISEDEGLYFGDDTDFLNGTEHRKLKFLPTTTDVISRPDAPALPTMIVTPDGDDLSAIMFDGTNSVRQWRQITPTGLTLAVVHSSEEGCSMPTATAICGRAS